MNTTTDANEIPFYCPECERYCLNDPVVFRGQITYYCPVCGYVGEDGSGKSRHFDLSQPAPSRLIDLN